MEFINSVYEHRPLIATFLAGGALGYILRVIVWRVKIYRQTRTIKYRRGMCLITSNNKSMDTASLRNYLKYAKSAQPNEQDRDKPER